MAIEVGTKVGVSLEGIPDVVAQAEIVEVDRENGLATLIVPATKVVVGIKVELDPTPVAPPTSGVQTVILGTEDSAPGGAVEPGVINPAPQVQAITPEPQQAAQSAVGDESTPGTPSPAAPVDNSNLVTPDTPKE